MQERLGRRKRSWGRERNGGDERGVGGCKRGSGNARGVWQGGRGARLAIGVSHLLIRKGVLLSPFWSRGKTHSLMGKG
jgi:hypothetical protein